MGMYAKYNTEYLANMATCSMYAYATVKGM